MTLRDTSIFLPLSVKLAVKGEDEIAERGQKARNWGV